MRREILVFIDRLRFRDYRKKVGNLKFAVEVAQITLVPIAVLTIFFSLIPQNHLLTLEHLIQEKELRATQLQNQIELDQGQLADLDEKIAERDKWIKLDDTTFEYLVREQFIQELKKERQEYFDNNFGKIEADQLFLKNPGPRLNEINSITLNSYYQDFFLKKTQYAYAHFLVLRPIFLDMRQSFSSFLQSPPSDYLSNCLIEQRSDGKYYLDVQGRFLPWDMKDQGYDGAIQPYKVIDARRYCLSQAFDDLIEKWAEDRGAVKGPRGIPMSTVSAMGPRP